jgi:hypothetical protein
MDLTLIRMAFPYCLADPVTPARNLVGDLAVCILGPKDMVVGDLAVCILGPKDMALAP